MRWRARVTCRLSVPKEFQAKRFSGPSVKATPETSVDYHGDVVDTFVHPIVKQFYGWVVRADLGWHDPDNLRVGPNALRFWQWEERKPNPWGPGV